MSIPKDIYLTWHTKDLPPKMKENVELLKLTNPEFTIHLYDDNDCAEFIKENFSIELLKIYLNLIPGAYKADLFRYCILYIKGGIYLDIKLRCINGFKLINLTDKEYFVQDRSNDRVKYTPVLNALMICQKNNIILKESINAIIDNVKKNKYCIDALDITGPLLLGRILHKYIPNYQFELIHIDGNANITYKNTLIIDHYPEYRLEQKMDNFLPHYGLLYQKKLLYYNELLNDNNYNYILIILLICLILLCFIKI